MDFVVTGTHLFFFFCGTGKYHVDSRWCGVSGPVCPPSLLPTWLPQAEFGAGFWQSYAWEQRATRHSSRSLPTTPFPVGESRLFRASSKNEREPVPSSLLLSWHWTRGGTRASSPQCPPWWPQRVNHAYLVFLYRFLILVLLLNNKCCSTE